jgi:hypothetical protein
MGRVVSSALGGGAVATTIGTVILPLITAFVTVPVPRGVNRARRVALVLGFAGAARAVRNLITRVLIAARVPGAKQRAVGGKIPDVSERTDLSAATDATSIATAHLTNTWLGHVAVTTAISLVPVTGTLAVRDLIRDHRSTAAVAGPAIHVPDRYIVRTGRRTKTPVTYSVTAVDHAGKPLVPLCDPHSGALFPLGATRVRCTARDAAGRTASASFTITVMLLHPHNDTHAARYPPTPAKHTDAAKHAHTAKHTSPNVKPPPSRKPPATVNDGAKVGIGTEKGSPVPGATQTQTTDSSGGTSEQPGPLPGDQNGGSQQSPSPGNTSYDLTGLWLLDYRPNYGTASGVGIQYTIKLTQLDNASCVSRTAPSCYGGGFWNLKANACNGRFNASAVESPSGISLSAISPDANGTQHYDGAGSRIAARPMRFSGKMSQTLQSGDVRTADFDLTHCAEQSTVDCPPHPECQW